MSRRQPQFAKGDWVRVQTGPFTNFVGIVTDVDLGEQRAKVEIQIFGRATPIDVDLRNLERD